MDISEILKGKGKPPPKPPDEAAKGAPRAEPPRPAEPPKSPMTAKLSTRYRLHRDVPAMEDMDRARRHYLELIRVLRAFLGSLVRGRPVADAQLEPLRVLASETLKLLRLSPNALLIYFTRGTPDDYLVGKLANTGVLAGRLGLQLGLPEAELEGLVLAGFLHGVGLAVSDRLDLEPRILEPREKEVLRRHCDAAGALLAGPLKEKALVLEVCLQHRERMDGTGYPKGLKGEQIAKSARLLAVAEEYEAMSHARPYRERLLPHEAMKRVIDMGGQLLDERVVKALIQCLSIYPPGSYVELNNKTVARVVGINPELPTRPLLLPLFSAEGAQVPESVFLDLSATPLVRIQDAVDETKLKSVDPKTALQLRSARWWGDAPS